MNDVTLKLWIALTRYIEEHQERLEKGQGTVEYSMLLVLVALVGVTTWAAFGTQIRAVLESIPTAFGRVTPLS